MLKEIIPSQKVMALLAAAYGDPAVTTADVAVFEAVAANGNPIRKRGLFAGARIQEDALLKMADWLKSGRHVPLQLMHYGGMPTGKVFAGEVSNGALNVLFYLPRKSEAALIDKLNTGVIAEVSVGIQNEKIICSECSFDYLGADATFNHVFDCTCAEGHVIGVEGVHAKLFGLNDFMEMSLVDRGGVPGASVKSRPQQTFSITDTAGFDRTALRLFASASVTEPKPTQENTVDLQAELVAAQVKVGLTEASVTSLQAAATAASAEITSLKAQNAALEAAAVVSAAALTAAQSGDVALIKADLSAAADLIKETAVSVLLLTGKTAADLPTLLSDQVKLVREGRIILTASIPTGGVSKGANTGSGSNAETKNYTAFTGRKEG